jgi:hypothetical protein
MATTQRPMVRIHDTATDEIIDRQMNDAEFAEYQSQVAARTAENAALADAQALKVAAYEKLGLTSQEIAAILG